MDEGPFANDEPEFRRLVPKAIELLDRCKMASPEAVPPDKILPVRASLASAEVDAMDLRTRCRRSMGPWSAWPPTGGPGHSRERKNG